MNNIEITLTSEAEPLGEFISFFQEIDRPFSKKKEESNSDTFHSTLFEPSTIQTVLEVAIILTQLTLEIKKWLSGGKNKRTLKVQTPFGVAIFESTYDMTEDEVREKLKEITRLT